MYRGSGKSTSGMEAVLQSAAPGRRPRRLGSGLVVAMAVLILWRAAPLARAYLDKLARLHSPGALLGVCAVAVLFFVLLWLGLWRLPRAAVCAVAALAAAMVVFSGNAAAAASAAILLGATLLVGDLAARLLRGRDAESGDLIAAFAAGSVAVGLIILALGEAGGLSRWSLAAVLAVVAAFRFRRVPALGRLTRESLRLPFGTAPRGLEAAWLALAGLVLLALWAGALGPDVSWDALAYHLPEARDVTLAGRVVPRPELAPQSLLWRNHDTYLSLGFFFGGERVVRLLQFATGTAVFGAALALARRLRMGGAAALVVLALAAFPTAILQMRATYVDWPAALFVTAAAAEFAAGRDEGGRLRLGGFLFGGAIATKIFALFAGPALAILCARARPGPRRIAAAAACALLALLPWLGWSARRAGSVAAPFASSTGELVERLRSGHYFTTSPASGVSAPPEPAGARLGRFLRLPYDLVFRSSRFEANGDGYSGAFVLLLLVGLAGWNARGLALFCLAALPFLAPWSLLYLPSIRFLFPVYPLYAVFCAEGLRRLTSGFAGRSGAAAAGAALAVAAAFPVQAGSSGIEWRVAFGEMSREASLDARLPDYSLWKGVRPGDRVLFLGENDRFYCPAGVAWRAEFLPVAAWGRDPGAWRRGLDRLGITHVLHREDRQPDGALIEALDDRLELVERRGEARLYRVRP
jgi:hypothetical protein